MRSLVFCLLLLFLGLIHNSKAQQGFGNDSLFLMNGKIYVSTVIDTSLGAVTILDIKDTSKRMNVEYDELYGVKYASTGSMYYYYSQDTSIINDFTRDEMWLYMKGERDAKKGFKGRGSLFGSMAAGIGGGITGNILGPLVPFAYLGLSGLPKVRIKHDTVSNPYYLDSDAYILGYERQARYKRKINCMIGGGIGLAIGFTANFLITQSFNNFLKFH
ncbi:MAG: hypothetical protein ACJ76F_03635 [Bacteroidia bacterium]